MTTVATMPQAFGRIDVEAFRLRRFVEQLADHGELDTISEPTDLIDVAPRLDGNPKAVLFRRPGAKALSLLAT